MENYLEQRHQYLIKLKRKKYSLPYYHCVVISLRGLILYIQTVVIHFLMTIKSSFALSGKSCWKDKLPF